MMLHLHTSWIIFALIWAGHNHLVYFGQWFTVKFDLPSSQCHLYISTSQNYMCLPQSHVHLKCVFACIVTGVKLLQVLTRRNRLFLLILVGINWLNIFLFIAFGNSVFDCYTSFFGCITSSLDVWPVATNIACSVVWFGGRLMWA